MYCRYHYRLYYSTISFLVMCCKKQVIPISRETNMIVLSIMLYKKKLNRNLFLIVPPVQNTSDNNKQKCEKGYMYE